MNPNDPHPVSEQIGISAHPAEQEARKVAEASREAE